MQDLKLIYDFADRFPRIGVMLFPLIFVAIGLIIFYSNKNIKSDDISPKNNIHDKKYKRVFGIFFASISGLIAILIIVTNLHEYFKTRNIYDHKQYQIVEGKVEHYHPMPEGGHDSERFDVKGIPFEFSDYDASDYGYNNTASKCGRLKNGFMWGLLTFIMEIKM